MEPAPAVVSESGPGTRGLPFEAPPADMPITDRLNVCLGLGVFAISVGLLWLGSRCESWYRTLAVGVVFSHVLLTNYALLHEATHGNLHSTTRGNFWLGVLTGILFPVPFSMVRSTHQGHHLRNRTDFEMFDLYYPTDSRFLKYTQWYGILFGLFWPWIPIGAVLFAVCPAVLRTRVFVRARSSRHLLGDIQGKVVRAIRWQVVLIVAFFAAAAWLLELKLVNTLILYACFSINWSTLCPVRGPWHFTQRVCHRRAFSSALSWWMSWLLLHGEYDLNHHRRPDVPGFTCRGCRRRRCGPAMSCTTGGSGWGHAPPSSRRRSRFAKIPLTVHS